MLALFTRLLGLLTIFPQLRYGGGRKAMTSLLPALREVFVFLPWVLPATASQPASRALGGFDERRREAFSEAA